MAEKRSDADGNTAEADPTQDSGVALEPADQEGGDTREEHLGTGAFGGERKAKADVAVKKADTKQAAPAT